MYYSLKNLRADIEATFDIEGLTEVYQETALFKMKQVRGSVLKTREFLNGVAEIYHHAKLAYFKKLNILLLGKKHDQVLADLAFVKRNGRNVYVLISSSQALYGDLIIKLYQKFKSDVLALSSNCDVIIIGSIGKILAEGDKLEEKIGLRVEYFNLDDEKLDWSKIVEILKNLAKYQKIIIYHPQFASVLHQVISTIDISGGASLAAVNAATEDYLFEPSEKAILQFFESEIIGSLFYQAIFEAQLSRFAARMVAMDAASQNSKQELERLEKESAKLQRAIINKKQLDRQAGRSLWQI